MGVVGLLSSGFIAVYTGQIFEFYEVFIKPETINYALVLCIIVFDCGGMFHFICTIMTVTISGPLALNISGTIKDVFSTYLAFLIFDDITPTQAVVVGLGFSFVGAIYGSYDKYRAHVQA